MTSKIKEFLQKRKIFSKISKIAPIEEGVSSLVYKILADGEVYYFRIRSTKYEDIEPESYLYKVLSKHGVKVPKIIYSCNDFELFGAPFMIVSAIKGYPLYKESHSTVINNVLKESSRYLFDINQFPTKGFGVIKSLDKTALIGSFKTYSEFVLDKIESKLSTFEKNNLVSLKKVKKLNKWIENEQFYNDYTSAHLAHGDFALSHIYVHKGRFSGFIDFSDIRASNTFHDLAHFYLYESNSYSKILIDSYSSNLDLKESEIYLRIKHEALFIAILKLAWVLENLPDNKNLPLEAKYINIFIDKYI